MGLNASSAYTFLNLQNNAYSGNKNFQNNQPQQEQKNGNDSGFILLNSTDTTYDIPNGSIYDTAGSIAYAYNAGNIHSPETTGTIASSGASETAGTIASSAGGETAGTIARSGSSFSGGTSGCFSGGGSTSSTTSV